MNKKLYESLINSIAKTVKKAINENLNTRMYNVFHKYEKVNEEPLTLEEAKELKNDIKYEYGYGFFSVPIMIQGIYTPDEQGFKEFLDDCGFEEYGQDYDAFIFAMENDEPYVN